MQRRFFLLLAIGLLNALLFTSVFSLFQNKDFYEHSLGKVSQNYERSGTWDVYEIKKVSKPFLDISNDHFHIWDAAIYKCISEELYSNTEDCFGNVRGAFFPLFPLLWRMSHGTHIGMAILNYLLFITSIAILQMLLLKNRALIETSTTYALLIALPSSIIFYIPYTESLFAFTFTLAVIGIMKKQYGLFFMGCFLLAMVRPASLFVLLAFLGTELFLLLKLKDYAAFFRKIALRSLPFILGFSAALAIQYVTSGSLRTMIDAQSQWNSGLKSIKEISDWSIEGFGLSSYSIFFICLPTSVLLILFLFKRPSTWTKEFLLNSKDVGLEYIVLVSCFYLVGIFIFTLMTSGGNLHSFFRFTLATPFFYVLLLYALSEMNGIRMSKRLIYLIICSSSLVVFLNVVTYGGERLSFTYYGLFLYLIFTLFFMFKDSFKSYLQIAMAIALTLASTAWNSYLLNMLFSNGWLFT